MEMNGNLFGKWTGVSYHPLFQSFIQDNTFQLSLEEGDEEGAVKGIVTETVEDPRQIGDSDFRARFGTKVIEMKGHYIEAEKALILNGMWEREDGEAVDYTLKLKVQEGDFMKGHIQDNDNPESSRCVELYSGDGQERKEELAEMGRIFLKRIKEAEAEGVPFKPIRWDEEFPGIREHRGDGERPDER